MLSPASLAIVRETLPAGAAAIPEITTVFYGKLFADHPSLLSDLFNRVTKPPARSSRPWPAPSHDLRPWS
jgi:hemoglobin-like flavoprotein